LTFIGLTTTLTIIVAVPIILLLVELLTLLKVFTISPISTDLHSSFTKLGQYF